MTNNHHNSFNSFDGSELGFSFLKVVGLIIISILTLGIPIIIKVILSRKN